MHILRSLALSATLLSSFSALNAAVPAQVKTDKGTVEGEATASGKAMAYKGIPFAAPPTGKLRWAPPAEAESWNGVRSAHEYGYHCVQSTAYADMAFHDPGASEDCLTLNVWTPASSQTSKLPVMVWIYGGGFAGGSTSERRQDGQYLAEKNVVVVSMNYRLGIFGFFAHPELTAESEHHASGNYGLLDQAAALGWVKKNIAEFGGDPSNITIFGESAGSMSVSSHMASPVSKDLFQKAIGESGGALGGSALPMDSRTQAEKAGVAFALNTFGTSKLADLRKIPTEDIIRPVLATHPRFAPIVDGYFFPKPVAEIYAAGEQAHIPLLAGWNSDEGRGGLLTPNSKVTSEGFAAQAEREFPGKSAEFLKLYSGTNDETTLTAASDYAGDKFIAYSTWRWLEAHASTGGKPVYRYYFALGNPGDRFHLPAMGAFHSDDIEYVFGTLASRPEAIWRAEDHKLSEQVMGYWTNFAKTGDPNGTGLPRWPVYNAKGWETMRLDKSSSAAPDKYRDRYIFLNDAWGKPRTSVTAQ